MKTEENMQQLYQDKVGDAATTPQNQVEVDVDDLDDYYEPRANEDREMTDECNLLDDELSLH